LNGYENALLNVQKCLELCPDYEVAKRLLSHIRFKKNPNHKLMQEASMAQGHEDYELALSIWDQLIEQESNNMHSLLLAYLWHSKGFCLRNLKRHEWFLFLIQSKI
jgi:tetratricopeptide (TPR) repeat protein